MSTVKRVENLSKYYRLGLTGGGTLRDDRGLAGQGARQARAAVAHWRTRSRQQQDGQISAPREASYQVREGAILGIIGRNGTGKSTLFEILCRNVAATVRRMRRKRPVARLLDLGSGFHGELSGREVSPFAVPSGASPRLRSV